MNNFYLICSFYMLLIAMIIIEEKNQKTIIADVCTARLKKRFHHND